MKRKIRTRATRKEVEKLIRNLPGILSGRLKSQFSLHRIYWGAVANSLFDSCYAGFDKKSHKQVDEGERWLDLKRHTKAYKRDVRQGQTKKSIISRRQNVLKQGGLGLLTPIEHALWKREFGKVYHRYKKKLGEDAAKVKAGKYAWWYMKERGAPTMWEVLGNRDLLILRRTNRLYNSYRPGSFLPTQGYRKSSPDQIYILHRGSIEVGSRVEYAGYAQAHRRYIWPTDMSRWLAKANEAGRDAVFAHLERILGR